MKLRTYAASILLGCFISINAHASSCGVTVEEGTITGSQTSPINNPTPSTPAKIPNLVVDYDVLHQDKHEISANCNNCSTDPVYPGQVIDMRVEVETEYRDVAKTDLYNPKSKSIDAEAHCSIIGRVDWYEIPGSEEELEFNVKNLKVKGGFFI